MTISSYPGRATALAALLTLGLAHAQSPATGIYTCVDAKGRRLTADRPIMECLDREQKVLSPRGTVKQVVPPSMTADERAAAAAQQQAEADQKAREAEARRRERALLVRYPNWSAHDKGRADALAQVEAVGATIRLRLAELDKERQRVDDEMEFYAKDPTKAPARLKHRRELTDRQTAEQQAALANQDREKERVNARFDAELERLKALWAQQPASASR